MTHQQAKRLAKHLKHNDRSAYVKAGRIVFTGGPHGEHSLDLRATSVARAVAHWQGYAGIEGATKFVAFEDERKGCLCIGRVGLPFSNRRVDRPQGLRLWGVHRVRADGTQTRSASWRLAHDDLKVSAI